MIGHYLLALTEAQEDRVLTRGMQPNWYWGSPHGGPCLVGTVGDFVYGRGFCDRDTPHTAPLKGMCVEECYDRACKRFGACRVNNAIRNRILSNRARRVLQNRPVEVEVSR